MRLLKYLPSGQRFFPEFLFEWRGIQFFLLISDESGSVEMVAANNLHK